MHFTVLVADTQKISPVYFDCGGRGPVKSPKTTNGGGIAIRPGRGFSGKSRSRNPDHGDADNGSKFLLLL